MICAVEVCKAECPFGDVFCPKHRRRFDKARKKGNEDDWWRSNRVRFDKSHLSKGGK